MFHAWSVVLTTFMPNRKHPPTLGSVSSKRKLCGVIQEAKSQAWETRAAQTKPQPWIVRKLMVLATFGIMGYAAYVYIGRFCVQMIRRMDSAASGRGTGIALLAVFSVLFLWMVWAYLKVILTPPGYAKDHVQLTSKPLFPPAPRPESWHSDIEMGARPHSLELHHPSQPSISTNQDYTTAADNSIAGPSYEVILTRPSRDSSTFMGLAPDQGRHLQQHPREGADILDMLPRPTLRTQKKPHYSKKGRNQRIEKERQRAINIFRHPPLTPALLPEHRYCSIDGIVKPYRTHHCRNCGTCVLKYDHHCPWIGQCVGARNQKFFVNFVQAASLFTLYTFATLLAYTVRDANRADGHVDPQELVIIALAAVFALFTTVLGLSHTLLIMRNQTTVESMHMRTMKERESARLRAVFGWWEFGAKGRTRRQWDEEWGAIGTEGNMWWMGSAEQNWVDVMGWSMWGWFLPVGRSLSDGLTYPVNPRFDEQGRWRRRAEWPVDLR